MPLGDSAEATVRFDRPGQRRASRPTRRDIALRVGQRAARPFSERRSAE